MKLNTKLALALGATALTLGVTAPAIAQDRGERPRMERGHDGGERMMRVRHHRGEQGQRMGRMQGFLEAFDTNGDGGLTQEEINSARIERHGQFDADANGTLSLAEFEALWLDAMRERMVDQFQRHDDDGDGEVTTAEFTKRFANIVARRDTNGDGVLNTDDMRRAPAK